MMNNEYIKDVSNNLMRNKKIRKRIVITIIKEKIDLFPNVK